MWITLTVRAEHGRAHRVQQGPRDRHQHDEGDPGPSVVAEGRKGGK